MKKNVVTETMTVIVQNVPNIGHSTIFAMATGQNQNQSMNPFHLFEVAIDIGCVYTSIAET